MSTYHNLVMSERLCLIGDRHLLVSCNDVVECERQLVRCNRQVFLFEDHEVKVVRCDGKSSTSMINWITESRGSNGRLVVIIRGLENTTLKFQVAMLEVMKARQPQKLEEVFLVVAIVESIQGSEMCLYRYLQDQFWFRQTQLVEPFGGESEVVGPESVLSYEEVVKIRRQVAEVTMIPEIRRYILDIIVFIRNHRIVVEGVATRFIKEFELLVKCLAVVNGYSYVTPVVVKLAARKFFPLRISVCDYEDEATLNWGSEVDLIRLMMQKWNADLVIEDVLKRVQPPI